MRITETLTSSKLNSIIELVTNDQDQLTHIQEVTLLAQKWLSEDYTASNSPPTRKPVRLNVMFHKVDILIQSEENIPLGKLMDFLRDLDDLT